jgi:hypothetical protein
MLQSEDGTVTGSIDVSKLDEIEPKTDEARAQLAALKAEVQAGQEPAAEDVERSAEAPAESEKADETGQAAEGQPKVSMAMSKDELVAAATAAGVDAEGKTKAELVEALGGQA